MTEEEQKPNPIAEGVDPAADAAGSDTLTQLRTENEKLKTAIRLGEAHRQITSELSAAGARSPGLLFASVRDDLQFADDGKLVNSAAIIARLKAEFPEQFGKDRVAESIDAGSGTASADLLTPASLAKMKPDEIAKLDWADVKRALSQ